MTSRSTELPKGLAGWAARSPSQLAKTLVAPLSDIHRAALETAELIEQLQGTVEPSDQLRVLTALEVWMFDELADQVAAVRANLEDVSKATSEAVG